MGRGGMGECCLANWLRFDAHFCPSTPPSTSSQSNPSTLPLSTSLSGFVWKDAGGCMGRRCGRTLFRTVHDGLGGRFIEIFYLVLFVDVHVCWFHGV